MVIYTVDSRYPPFEQPGPGVLNNVVRFCMHIVCCFFFSFLFINFFFAFFFYFLFLRGSRCWLAIRAGYRRLAEIITGNGCTFVLLFQLQRFKCNLQSLWTQANLHLTGYLYDAFVLENRKKIRRRLSKWAFQICSVCFCLRGFVFC